jgi:hypothetical protein
MDPVQDFIQSNGDKYAMIAADGRIYDLSGLARAQGVLSYRVQQPLYAAYALNNSLLQQDEVDAAIASGDPSRIFDAEWDGAALGMAGETGVLGSARSSAGRPQTPEPREAPPLESAKPMAPPPPGSRYETAPPVAVSGKRAIDRARSYENAIRQRYSNATKKDRDYDTIVNGEPVSGVADDITVVDGKPTAVDAKYVDEWNASLRNPASPIADLHLATEERAEMLEQAKKYTTAFEGGVIYVTNSTALANYYTQIFHEAQITNFRFVIAPAVRGEVRRK